MLKSLSTFYEPDPRFENLVSFNESTQELRKIGPADLHEQVASLSFDAAVPESVRHQFALALNVYLYSWFVYDFATVAEQQAYAALEAALRLRYQAATGKPAGKAGLKRLFDFMMARKWLDTSDFDFPLASTPGGKFSELEMLRMLRNNLAHGRFHLLPGGSYAALKTCHFIIARLFNAKSIDAT